MTRDDLFAAAAQYGVDPTSLMANMVIPPDHATDRVPLTRKLLARLAKMPALTGSTVTTIPVYVVDQAWTAGLARVFFAPLPPGAPWRFDVHIYTFDAGFAAAHGIDNDAPDTPDSHRVQVKLLDAPMDRERQEIVRNTPLNLSPKDSLKSLESKMTLLDVTMQNDSFAKRDGEQLVLATEWNGEVMAIDAWLRAERV
ncbi:hypothetical protein H9P43_006779 [Blastocladiella emersonii ATCC 22665]|nr:hypothetical protein H9P43_006779 [Blastocladiella emersonii ATCC 22665]